MKALFYILLSTIILVQSKWSAAMEVDSLVMKGLDLTFAMRFDEAIAQFDQVIAKDTTHPSGYFMKSAVYFWKFTRNYRSQSIGDEFETVSLHALEIAEDFLEDNEDNQDGMFYLGGIYGNLGRYYAIKRSYWNAYWYGRKGKNYLEDLVEINPNYYDAYLGLGIYHYYAAIMPRFLKFFSFILGIDGEKEQGIRELQLAIEKGTLTNNEARIFLSTIYLRIEHEYEKALTLLEELYQQYPENPAFKVSLGWAYTRLNDDDKALLVFDEILNDKNLNFQLVTNQALYYSGDIYFKRNNFNKAIEYYQKVIANSADKEENRHWIYARALLSTGKCMELAGDRRGAVSYYRQIKEEYSEWTYNEAENRLKNPYTLVDRKLIQAENFSSIAKYDTAFVLFDELLNELKGRDDDDAITIKAKVYHYQGKSYLEQNKYKIAIEYLQETLDLIDEPEWLVEWTHYYIGRAFEAIGQTKLAKDHFEEAVDSDSFRLKNLADVALSKLEKKYKGEI